MTPVRFEPAAARSLGSNTLPLTHCAPMSCELTKKFKNIASSVKCKILKLSTKKCQGCFQAAPLPPPPKKKNPGSAYGRLTNLALIPCMDPLLNVQITPINLELAAFQNIGVQGFLSFL